MEVLSAFFLFAVVFTISGFLMSRIPTKQGVSSGVELVRNLLVSFAVAAVVSFVFLIFVLL